MSNWQLVKIQKRCKMIIWWNWIGRILGKKKPLHHNPVFCLAVFYLWHGDIDCLRDVPRKSLTTIPGLSDDCPSERPFTFLEAAKRCRARQLSHGLSHTRWPRQRHAVPRRRTQWNNVTSFHAAAHSGLCLRRRHHDDNGAASIRYTDFVDMSFVTFPLPSTRRDTGHIFFARLTDQYIEY